MRSFLLSVAFSIGGGCGRALVCGYPNWFSGLSSASVQYFGFALGLRWWRKCRVTRTCVNVGTSLVAHARISIQRNVKEESLYMCRRSDWIMHLYILTQQSAHPIHLGYGPAVEHRQSDPLARYIISTKNVSACKQIDQSYIQMYTLRHSLLYNWIFRLKHHELIYSRNKLQVQMCSILQRYWFHRAIGQIFFSKMYQLTKRYLRRMVFLNIQINLNVSKIAWQFIHCYHRSMSWYIPRKYILSTLCIYLNR